MMSIQRGLLLVLAAGAISLPSMAPTGTGRGRISTSDGGAAPVGDVAYTPDQTEYYLSANQVAYIRPGLNVKIGAITQLAAGKKPIVEVFFTDNLGGPLDRLGVATPGPITQSFAMGRWDPSVRYYVPITGRITNGVQGPGGDQGGTWTDLEVGHAKYNFGQAIPASTDPTAGITMLLYGGRRNMTGITDKDYIATNTFYDFRLDGMALTTGQVWGVMDTSKSCNKCHDPLGGLPGGPQFHGGQRNQAKACAICHSNLLGTGGEANAKLFFHKLHMGKHLPSVVAGGTYTMAGNDYSTVGWPGINNNAPYDCTTCHEQTAPDKDVWKTAPGRIVCGSCHDNVNFATGQNHGPAGTSTVGPLPDDSQCASCHPADPPAGVEFDASVKGSHVVPLQSAQLKGLKAAIVSVSNFAPGQKPTVVFNVDNADGTPVDASKLGTFAPIFAGPTSSYTTNVRESAVGKATFDATTGYTTYTFTAPVPASATGTWAVSVDIERAFSLVRGDGQPNKTGNESPVNPVGYYSVDGTPVQPRRTSVTMAQCNSCHGALGLHGGQRLVIEECVFCHNPVADDSIVRPAAANPAESISLQRMIHRIHSGENLTQVFTVYGNRGSLHPYNDVRFPGDRRDCAKCHTSTGYYIPLPRGIDSVTTLRDFFTPQGPATAACLGCHDAEDFAAHAYINTANLPSGRSVEACGACHAAGNDLGVDKVHAR
ncbi:MAG: OmcA/MtrC family decaheme c-type cytochrome [Thermoanaerobaculia bacterium]